MRPFLSGGVHESAFRKLETKAELLGSGRRDWNFWNLKERLRIRDIEFDCDFIRFYLDFFWQLESSKSVSEILN